MRGLRSYGDINFETVSAELNKVSGVQDLRCVRRKRMVLSLIESRITFEFYRHDEKTASSSASAREIGKILGSLHRIAQFAKKAKASASINDGLERMISLEKSVIPAGFEISDRRRVRDFFDVAGDVYKTALVAQRAMESEEKQTPLGESPISAIEWLVGCRLPEIYADTFKVPFTTTRGNNPAIDFVQSALAAIKVRAIEEETIISHYKAAQKAQG